MAHRIEFRCDDYDVIGAVPRDLSIIKNFLKRDCAVKRLIDMEEEFLNECVARGDDPMKPKKKERKSADSSASGAGANGKEEPKQPVDPCASTSPKGPDGTDLCDPCRQLKTSVLLEELTKPATFNNVYDTTPPPFFDEETIMGSALPVKFRFRKKANLCDYDKTSNLMCSPTENTNVVVLTNCCDIMVWPSQRVAQMNRVPVTMISGPGDLTEYMLEEETVM